jgi:hypothetical protein
MASEKAGADAMRPSCSSPGEIETIVGAASVEPSVMRQIGRCHGETGRNVALGGWMRGSSPA